jgi:hypothetical protein
MTKPARKQRDADAPKRKASRRRWRRIVRRATARFLRRLFAPVIRPIVKHQVVARRFGGLGSLVFGAGLLVGGLGPLGLSLIFVGTALLLVELEESRPAPPEQQRK